MKIFSTKQIKEIDAYTIEHEPISSIDLMERASLSFTDCFCEKFDNSKEVLLFAGPGNNGGDGLAIARILARMEYRVSVYLLNLKGTLSSDCLKNLHRLKSVKEIDLKVLNESSPIPLIPDKTVIIDAIFGSGLSRPVSGYIGKLIQLINSSKAEVVSVDIPSGLFGENNLDNNVETIIQADHTITFEIPFLSFFFRENSSFIGNWHVVSIGIHPDTKEAFPSDHIVISKELCASLLKMRDSFSHKGSLGHSLIIAGSYGMMGAATLAVKACLRGGSGLVTAHLPRLGYNIMQIAVPEALISIDQSDIIFTHVDLEEKFNAIGMGPGLNTKSNTSKAVLKIIQDSKVPMLIDADALNILANNKDYLKELATDTILSPHPGEFDRLFGKSHNEFERHQKQIENSKKYGVVIILKGRYTMITLSNGSTYINSTGNSGLATGGSGDVLTGLITSLLAQNYKAHEAAILGIYLHGLAADIALKDESVESLLPSDVIKNLGKAFGFVRDGKV